MNGAPVIVDLVLAGGGHAHLEVLRRFGLRPLPGLRITLISREIHTPYSGMLPGLVAGHYAFADAHVDLRPLARFAGAHFHHDEVTGLDLERRRVVCKDRPPVAFDLLSIDTGAVPATVPGAAGHAVPVKPVSSFAARWEALRVRVSTDRGAVRIGVVGGGAGGVELLMAVRHRLRTELAAAGDDPARLRFELLTASDEILPGHNARARRLCRRALREAGVAVRPGCEVVAVEPGAVRTAAGGRIALDEVLWVTAAAAPGWLREAGLATDDAGFVLLDDCLQSPSHPGVFAAGDVAHVARHPRPRSGVFAVRQGPPLAANLRRAARGEPLRPFVPQRRSLSLISTGERHAIASRGVFAFAGGWVWRWKDAIDRRFVRRYVELPTLR